MMYVYLLEGRNHMFYTVIRKSKIKPEDLLIKLQNKEPECVYKNLNSIYCNYVTKML